MAKKKEDNERVMISMKIKQQEPMWKHTTWKIGGPADQWMQPESIEELQEALQLAQKEHLPWYVIGGGSNLLVSDDGIRGIVIQLGGSLAHWEIRNTCIYTEAGVPLPLLSRKAAENALSGLEFAAGIPGTVGGAIVMNAGAYQDQISNLVESVTYCDGNGNLHILSTEECEFAYRNSIFKRQKDKIIVSAVLRLQSGKRREDVFAQMKKNNMQRKEKQPVEYPSAGSIFKNPPGDTAGRLIECSGGKGLQHGGAMVSEKHGNFIVNTGTATCEDVLHLVDLVKQNVLEKTGILLEEEILLLGKENL